MSKKKTATENSGKPKAKPRGRPMLANLKPFKPGESGNPGGAPKGERFETIFYKYAAMPTKDVVTLMSLATSHAEKLAELPYQHTMVLRTMAAYHNDPNASFLAQILDRTEGKVADKHELFGVDGKDLIPPEIGLLIAKVYGN